MLAAFANTFRIPELRKRILFTVGLVFICRLVSMVPTPGVDWHALEEALNRIREQTGGGGLMGWFDVFSGGAMSQCSVGFFSIWPYISATIVVQLLTAVIPALERLSREGDAGRAKINQYARYLTLVLVICQSYALAAVLEKPGALGMGELNLVDPSFCGLPFRLLTVLTMTTSTMFIVWLGDQITLRGIGNGSSVVIMVNICSRLPAAIFEAWQRYFTVGGASIFELLLLLVLGFLVVMGTVMLTQGLRKIPIHSTKRVVGTKQYGGQNTYMPLRVNYSGVMPIIFAQPLIQFSGAAMSRISPDAFATPFLHSILVGLQTFGSSLNDMASPVHILCYAVLIFFFSYFWVATQFNAVRISDDLKRNGSYVPGIRPGMATAEHLDMVMTRVTFFGALGLVTVAIVPQALRAYLKIPWEMSSFFGGSSLLIVVGVALDTLRQMESHLLMRNYDGFLKHGRLQGRK
ncbi:MAG: preprotein translocase subunit SecY [bacterium]